MTLLIMDKKEDVGWLAGRSSCSATMLRANTPFYLLRLLLVSNLGIKKVKCVSQSAAYNDIEVDLDHDNRRCLLRPQVGGFYPNSFVRFYVRPPDSLVANNSATKHSRSQVQRSLYSVEYPQILQVYLHHYYHYSPARSWYSISSMSQPAACALQGGRRLPAGYAPVMICCTRCVRRFRKQPGPFELRTILVHGLSPYTFIHPHIDCFEGEEQETKRRPHANNDLAPHCSVLQ